MSMIRLPNHLQELVDGQNFETRQAFRRALILGGPRIFLEVQFAQGTAVAAGSL